MYQETKDLGLTCVCAIRYALGRMTYIPKAITEFVMQNTEYISKKYLYVMRDDVSYALNTNRSGDPRVDKPIWDNFYKFLDNKINELEAENNDG